MVYLVSLIGSKRTVKRIPWTEEERSAVNSEIEHFLRIRKTPGKLDCDNCLRKYQCLSRRNWKDIKNFVYNCIQSYMLDNINEIHCN